MRLILSSEEFFPEPEKVNSILNVKLPSNTSEVRSFLGLVSYCCKFIPNIATITEPLRQLTLQKADFIQNRKAKVPGQCHKTFIFRTLVLSYFYPAFETKIVADSSKQGLGAVFLQKNLENSVFQPVAFTSLSLSDAETRHSQTKRETLAVVFSCERFKNSEYELQFAVVTNHKPLLKLYSPSCSEPPTRIHRWFAINKTRWRFYKSHIHMKPYHVLRKELTFHDGVSKSFGSRNYIFHKVAPFSDQLTKDTSAF